MKIVYLVVTLFYSEPQDTMITAGSWLQAEVEANGMAICQNDAIHFAAPFAAEWGAGGAVAYCVVAENPNDALAQVLK